LVAVKKLLPILFTACISLSAIAQTRSRVSFGLSVNPFYTWSIHSSESEEKIAGTTTSYKTYSDSVSKIQSSYLSFGATGWVNYFLNQDWSLQIGVGYADIGFMRLQDNIQYLDKLYPGIGTGKVIEKSTSQKSIEYQYRFRYLQIPLLANYTFKAGRNFNTTYSLTGGLLCNVLLNHRLKANLVNWVMDGERTFYFDSTGYAARPMNMQLMLGARTDIRIDKQWVFMIQPFFSLSLFSVTSAPLFVTPYQLGANIGLVYEIRGGGN
jgi:hypothetical protein